MAGNIKGITIEDGKEVEEESIAITVVGDNASGILKVSYSPEDAGYKTLFETPTIPKVKQQI